MWDNKELHLRANFWLEKRADFCLRKWDRNCFRNQTKTGSKIKAKVVSRWICFQILTEKTWANQDHISFPDNLRKCPSDRSRSDPQSKQAGGQRRASQYCQIETVMPCCQIVETRKHQRAVVSETSPERREKSLSTKIRETMKFRCKAFNS